jgi:hypothetical protein
MNTGRLSVLLLATLLAAGDPGAILRQAAAADSLSQLRSDVRAPDPPLSREDKSHDDEDCRPKSYSDDDPCDGIDDDEDSLWGELLAPLAIAAGAVGTSPFWGPPLMIGDGYHHPGYFPEYPYQYERGYMMVDYVDLYDGADVREKYPWAWRARPDYGTNFSGLQWIGGNVLFETTPRIGAETDFRFLTEELPFGGHDDLWLGDANLFWRFAQSDQTQMRAGVGFNWLSDREHSDFGFNATYAIDWYPIQPVVISAEMDLGNLNEAWLFHIRTSAGVTWHGMEAFVGYDLYDIDHFQAQGLVAGMRLWF